MRFKCPICHEWCEEDNPHKIMMVEGVDEEGRPEGPQEPLCSECHDTGRSWTE